MLLAVLPALPALVSAQVGGQPKREAAYRSEFYANLTVEAGRATLSLNDPRPLAKAAELLGRRFGWRIHYEDPPYAHESELRDVTPVVARQPVRNPSKRVVVPRGGALEVTFAVSRETGEPELPEIVLEAILLDHHKRGNAGAFGVRQSKDGFTIVPDRIRDSRGHPRAVTPILDAPISFPKEERVLGETLALILEQVTASAGARIGLGSVGANFLLLNRAHIGADSERARDVVERLLRSIYPGRSGYTPQTTMAWHVYYQPGWGYAFNLRPVAASRLW